MDQRPLGVLQTMTPFTLTALMGVVAFTVLGCGGGGDNFKPELGAVKGTVTINGKPAPDLIVSFEPQAKGGKGGSIVGVTSTGKTDAQGNYELQYQGTGGKVEKGAAVGQHIVRIEGGGGVGPAGGAEAVAVTNVPAKYNKESTLKADVVAGENPPKNFELKDP